jgi:hypothetical protein
VTDAAPAAPQVDALTADIPFPSAVTSPDADTVTIAGWDEDHEKDRSGTVLPFALRALAVSWVVAPSASRLVALGETATESTASQGSDGSEPQPTASATLPASSHERIPMLRAVVCILSSTLESPAVPVAARPAAAAHRQGDWRSSSFEFRRTVERSPPIKRRTSPG